MTQSPIANMTRAMENIASAITWGSPTPETWEREAQASQRRVDRQRKKEKMMNFQYYSLRLFLVAFWAVCILSLLYFLKVI